MTGHPLKSAPCQQGSALIIALVFLLLMTMVGVSALQQTTLQERMAGNLRDRNLAFQASEAALRAGERWLDEGANMLIAEGTATPTDPRSWDGAAYSGIYAMNDLQLADDPRYRVSTPRLVRERSVDIAGEGAAGAGSVLSYYPVLSRGVGGTDSAIAIVQSYCLWPCRP
ncbi:pilus assembly PilX family protein [Ectothiorhodospira lacustris]|uniref:pilus assembly PilX family protein n=1 Tax=Ectothiorhodospira lacustris TaxID=2899127 RepID=UPI001EE894FC|nr:PilX N-terminal domain-containing pilus assembly protein [Ectothiorhodospira lacustris]MCG5509823.1 PilX N-terminal domain-containing pilus assembly protein [Ectothiorhodospira lacustris]MCG5521076.1 PilX N-terminal domain-containing pilus assembly protein [Ectothiorhodospira lacustris]